MVERQPIVGHPGLSGASLESLVLRDGQRLILKKQSPASDFVMRRAHDEGRVLRMWSEGVLARIPEPIDHAIVAVGREGDEIAVVMRDLTDALVGDRIITREENLRILAAVARMHEEFWGAEIPYLCSLRDWVSRFSPLQGDTDHPLWDLIARGWDLFADVVPSDVVQAVHEIHRDPEPMARALEAKEKSLVHGDLRLANIGLQPNRVVLLDWGSFTAMAPPAMEFAWYLAISWAQIDADIDDIVADFRAISGQRFDPNALDLGFLLAFAHLGWNKALAATGNPDAATRARELEHIDWWVAQVRRALENSLRQ